MLVHPTLGVMALKKAKTADTDATSYAPAVKPSTTRKAASTTKKATTTKKTASSTAKKTASSETK